MIFSKSSGVRSCSPFTVPKNVAFPAIIRDIVGHRKSSSSDDTFALENLGLVTSDFLYMLLGLVDVACGVV